MHTNIVVIGGGTGSFTILSGLKEQFHNITALVSMADDGGSTGVLRDELGALPPGDVRQCLVALSDTPLMRDLFNYRFPAESFASGHSFGNLFLSALEQVTGSFSKAVEAASQILNVKGAVSPMTLDNVRLVMEDDQGHVLVGEDLIGEAALPGRRAQFRLQPAAAINPAAKAAIMAADIVVLAPGDLYTSLAPALLVAGVGDALRTSHARLVYVCNLVTTHGQTDSFAVHDFAAEIERFIGGPHLHYVLYNTQRPSAGLLQRYAKDNEFGVAVDAQRLADVHYKAVGLPLLAGQAPSVDPNDTLFKRNYIRHDPVVVAAAVRNIIA